MDRDTDDQPEDNIEYFDDEMLFEDEMFEYGQHPDQRIRSMKTGRRIARRTRRYS